MTPSMLRCAAAHAALTNGRPPTAAELAARLGVRPQTLEKTLWRFKLAGRPLPLTRDPGGVRGRAAKTVRLVALLRLADRALSECGDPNNATWAQFRREAAGYLAAE